MQRAHEYERATNGCHANPYFKHELALQRLKHVPISELTLAGMDALIGEYIDTPHTRKKFYIALKKIHKNILEIQMNPILHPGERDQLKIKTVELDDYLEKHFGLAGRFDISYFGLSLTLDKDINNRVKHFAPLAALEKIMKLTQCEEELALINSFATAEEIQSTLFIFENNQLFCTVTGPKLTLRELAKLSFLGDAFPGRGNPDSFFGHRYKTAEEDLAEKIMGQLQRGDKSGLDIYHPPALDAFMQRVNSAADALLTHVAAVTQDVQQITVPGLK